MMRVWYNRVWNKKGRLLLYLYLHCSARLISQEGRRRRRRRVVMLIRCYYWWNQKNKVLSYDETKETTEQQNKKLEYVEMKVKQ